MSYPTCISIDFANDDIIKAKQRYMQILQLT